MAIISCRYTEQIRSRGWYVSFQYQFHQSRKTWHKQLPCWMSRSFSVIYHRFWAHSHLAQLLRTMPKHDCPSSPVPLLACIHRAPAWLRIPIVPVFVLMHTQQYRAKAHLIQPRQGQECVPLSLFWQLFLLNYVAMRGGKNNSGLTPLPTLLYAVYKVHY